ncbi:MAG TPA: LysR family transcriptional regulator [Myxococcales bacterium]|nr:LysR family transcriptional regulator [Myxococcales bacterium]
MTLTVAEIEAFLAVAERGSVTEAARQLGLNQPTLTRQLQKLEGEVGMQLVTRTPRGAKLTDAGKRFVRRAREALDALRQGVAELHELAQTPRGPVAVGSLPTVGAYVLPALIESFLVRYPDVQLRVAEGLAGELEEHVAAGLIDLAVTTLPLQRVDLVAQKLWTEPFMLAAPVGHRLTRARRAVSMSALAAEPLVIVGGSSANAAIRAACEATGREPRIAIEVDHPQSQRRMVERGVGVALMPAIMARDHAGGRFDVVEVTGAPRRTVALVHRGEPSLTYGARALKRLMVERLRKTG